MSDSNKSYTREVAAIITAMTDGEKAFIKSSVESILLDSSIGQVIICVATQNDWLEPTLGSLTADPRLTILRLPMASQAVVRNRALEWVNLSWVAYCDGDDVWCEGKTSAQLAYAQKTNSDFVGADHFLIDERGRIKAYAMAHLIPMLSSWMVRTEVMRQYPFDESVPPGEEDGEWWIRTKNLIHKVRYPKMFLKYRVRSGSSSSSAPSKQRKARIISLASIPVLGIGVLVLTWCIWQLKRQNQYVWLEEWEINYPQTQSMFFKI